MTQKLFIFALLAVSFTIISCNREAQNQSLIVADSITSVIDEKVVFTNDTIASDSSRAN